MSKKIPLGIAIALIFITIAATVAVTVTVYMNVYNELIEDLPQRAQLYSKLSDIDELVRAQYYGNVDSEKLNASIAKGYIEGLDDEYSVYLSAEEYAEYYSEMLGNVSGIGLEAAYDKDSGYLLVGDVAQDSPAALAGIEKGFYITAVDTEIVTQENAGELLASFGGDKLTSINLSILSIDENGDEVSNTVNVAKGYKAQSCYYSISGTVGYIRLTAFYENTAESFSEAISYFNENGVTGIIIDVRNNVSDNLEYAVDVIDIIVPLATDGVGALAVAKNSNGDTVEIYSSDASSISLPIAVLMNDRTEGAAELLACDLRDFGKARLIGETTAGHGTMQKIFRLDDGGAVLLTVAKIYPYISDCYDDVGVLPDEIILTTENIKNQLAVLPQTDDVQYQAAYSYLTE